MSVEPQSELSIDPRQADPSVVVKRIRVLASAEQVGLVDGQSKILNWVHNWLLSRLKADYGRFCDLGDDCDHDLVLPRTSF